MKLAIVYLLLTLSIAMAKNPVVVIETTTGAIEVELDEVKAPISVKNFLQYVDAKFYDGTIFHRVIKNFMVQGGGFNDKMEQKKTNAPIINEASNGLKNETGTIAMARTSDVNSATSQFFINVQDNTPLDHQNTTQAGFGYAVFGKVIQGMHVLKRMEMVRTGNLNGHGDVPMDTIFIKSIRRK